MSDSSDDDDEGPTGDNLSVRAESETPFKSLYQLMDEAASTTKNALRSPPEDPAPHEGPEVIFNKALTSIRNFRWKDDKTSDSNSKLNIPFHMAQRWVARKISYNTPSSLYLTLFSMLPSQVF